MDKQLRPFPRSSNHAYNCGLAGVQSCFTIINTLSNALFIVVLPILDYNIYT